MNCQFPLQVLFFVSSEILKRRLLKGLLAHPVKAGPPPGAARRAPGAAGPTDLSRAFSVRVILSFQRPLLFTSPLNINDCPIPILSVVLCLK